MATALVAGTLVMNANMQFSVTNTGADGSVQSDPFQNNAFSIVPAAPALFYHNQYVIALSTTLTITLSALTDALGNAVAFATIYGFMIQNMNTTAGQFVNVGNSNFATWIAGTTPTVKVGPKGCLFLASTIDGYAVVASTGDQLKIQNPSGTVSVTVKVTAIGA